MLDMPRPRLPYTLREVTRHGKVVWYFRRGEGKRTRLPGEYGSPGFMAVYKRLLAGDEPKERTRADVRTLAWLVEQYKRSAHWSGLDDVTRRRRDSIFRKMCEKAGKVDARTITRRTIERALEERSATPEAANNFLKAVRPMFAYGVKINAIPADPAAGVKQTRRQTDGFHMWTEDEVAAFEETHPLGTRARLALDLLLYTGLRRSDLVQVGRQHVRDGVLTIRPQKTVKKTGVSVSVRLLAPVLRSIAATKTGPKTFLVTEYGKPFTAAGFTNWFRDRCREAGVPGSAHGLRKVAATRVAENGGTTKELMAMFGWESAELAEHYTKKADRKRMSIAASEKFYPRTFEPGAGISVENDEKSIT